MAKTTIITAQDSVGLDDENNFQSVSEQKLKESGVDLNSIDFKGLKPLKKEWFNDIIQINIDNIPVEPKVCKQSADNSFHFAFESEKERKLFHSYFTKEIFRSVNTFLQNKDLNIKKYNRILVFETFEEKLTLNIRY